MLVVLTTDAVASPDDLDTALRAATRVSFDRLDSDGCMSTNDTVTVLASGASGITPSLPDLTDALTRACTDLAMQLLADAEGADHEIAITVLQRGHRGRGRRGRRGRSPAATCSRRRSSATTPTGAGSWPASAPRRRPSTRPTSTSR